MGLSFGVVNCLVVFAIHFNNTSNFIPIQVYPRLNTHKQTQKGSNQESMQSGNKWSNIEKLCWAPGSAKYFFGLRTPQPKRIRAPVGKMIGLWAPQQKFQGSRDPPFVTLSLRSDQA